MKKGLLLVPRLGSFFLLFLFHYSALLFAQGSIVINEVLYDPTGTNAGSQLIELKNVGTAQVVLNGWQFCARRNYNPIPGITIGPGQFLVVHVGAAGADTQTDIFLPTMSTLQTVSDLSLYLDSNFDNPGSMVDFVQWGGVHPSPTGRESEADAAGQWTAGQFVPTVAEGHSVEFDGEGNSSGDWFDQPNPTIGSENGFITTVNDETDILPKEFILAQNYPNPFNPTTVIEFSLPEEVHVSLQVYGVLGNEVAVLVDRRYTSGTYTVNVDAKRWSSGVYLYQLNAGGYSRTLKMLLLK